MVVKFTPEEQQKLNLMFEEWMESDHQRKLDNYQELNKSVIHNEIVFTGDSITEGYPFGELFPPEIIIYNRGISAITSTKLLAHIKTQVLDLKPRKLFVLIGTNDIERDIPLTVTAKTIENICQETIHNIPNIKIYVLSVYPVNETKTHIESIGKRRNKDIKDLNKLINKIVAQIKGCQYIDLYEYLLKDGNLNERYTYDGLHLNIEGYRAVTNILTKYVSE